MPGKGKKFTGAKALQRDAGIGRSLVNAHEQDKRRVTKYQTRHSTDYLANGAGQSLVDESNVLELVAKASLEQKAFSAKKDIKIVNPDEDTTTAKPTFDQQQFMNQNRQLLRVPRRAAWNAKMSKQEVEENELKSFYLWRQQLAELEENRTVAIAPFEKNLDFWRQLWRVVEFSDLVIQIVDARNPNLFFSSDLFQYCREVAAQQKRRKTTLLMLNKADLVPRELRERWSEYFRSKGIQHVFFSALREEAILKYLFKASTIDHQNAQSVESQLRHGDMKAEDYTLEREVIDKLNGAEADRATTTTAAATQASSKFMQEYNHRELKREKRQLAKLENKARIGQLQSHLQTKVEIPEVLLKTDDDDIPSQFEGNALPDFIGSAKIITRKSLLKLIDLFQAQHRQQVPNSKYGFTVGTVGFPNIGKSSVINVLSVETGLRTAVGDTPGKTKHFQTIQLSPCVKLCDCPGLIFPSFAHCRADFVLNGILPVDKERDYVGFLKLLCKRIPARIFNKLYQLDIKEDDKFKTGVGMTFGEKKQEGEYFCTYDQLLRAYEDKYGTEYGVIGRKIVKDLFCGRLLWIALPPQRKQKITKMSDAEYRELKRQRALAEAPDERSDDVEKLECDEIDGDSEASEDVAEEERSER